MNLPRQPSCDDPTDPELLPVAEARARLQAQLKPVSEHERVALADALGRVLADTVVSPIDVPSHTNSAMDGYAIHSGSVPDEGIARLQLIDTAWAGRPASHSVQPGEAVRIFTGGIMPPGADTVVIQEHVQLDAEHVLIDSTVKAGRNVRHAGEDVESGQVVMQTGVRLMAAELGLLASLGIRDVVVHRPLRVAFFTTGDELRSLDEHAGETLAPGLLFDSNRYTLLGMLQRLGVTIIDLGIVRDNADETREAFLAAARSADVIVTSGGVSAGDADHVTQVFHEIGNVTFWKLAMRPGRPLAFGHIGEAQFFGLPGNPVAVMVTFLEFVQPALKRLMGMTDTEALSVRARCLSSLRKSPGRVEYQRGVLSHDEAGELTVSTTGKQGAGRLSSMVAANCMIVLSPGADRVEAGSYVDVQPFHGLM